MAHRSQKSDRKQQPGRSTDTPRGQLTATRPSREKRNLRQSNIRRLWSGHLGGWIAKGRRKARSVLKRPSVHDPAEVTQVMSMHEPMDDYVMVEHEHADLDAVVLTHYRILTESEGTTNLEPPKASNLAALLQNIDRKRARVYHEKYGVKEQTRHLQYKRDEVAKAVAVLDQEISTTSSDSAESDRWKLLDSTQQVRITLSELSVAENELDGLNARLMEEELHLKDAEDQLYHQLTGQELLSGIDVVNDVLNRISSRPSSRGWKAGLSHPDSERSRSFYGSRAFAPNEEVESRKDSASADADGRPWTSSEEPQELDRGMTQQRWHLDSDPLPDLDTLILEEVNDPKSTIYSESDKDVMCAGDQFKLPNETADAELELTQMERSVQHDQPLLISREHDLASTFEPMTALETDHLSASKTVDPAETSALGSEHHTNLWLLEVFKSSWLQFFDFVRFSESSLRNLISIIGYINLSLLIRAKWFCDGTDRPRSRIPADISVNPSISSGSDDVPLFTRQVVYTDSNGEVHKVENLELSQDQPQPEGRHRTSNVAEPGENDRRKRICNNSCSSKESKMSDSVFSRPKREDTTKTEPQGNNLFHSCDDQVPAYISY